MSGATTKKKKKTISDRFSDENYFRRKNKISDEISDRLVTNTLITYFLRIFDGLATNFKRIGNEIKCHH